MSCEKTYLEVIETMECHLCGDEVTGCCGCDREPELVKEDWYCYSDGDKHYCSKCWLKSTKSRGSKND